MTKKIQTLQNGTFEVSKEQYHILSWYATIMLESDSDKKTWQLWGLETAGISAKIAWEAFYDIKIHGRIYGYQNMNKLSGVQTFDYNLK